MGDFVNRRTTTLLLLVCGIVVSALNVALVVSFFRAPA